MANLTFYSHFKLKDSQFHYIWDLYILVFALGPLQYLNIAPEY